MSKNEILEQETSEKEPNEKELNDVLDYDDEDNLVISETTTTNSYLNGEAEITSRVQQYLRGMGFELNCSGLELNILPSTKKEKAEKQLTQSSQKQLLKILHEEDSISEHDILLGDIDDESSGSSIQASENSFNQDEKVEFELDSEQDGELSDIRSEITSDLESGSIESQQDNIEKDLLIRADQIDFTELDRILRIKPHSRFIRWLLTDNVLRKALVSVFTHHWPRNISVPTKRFRHAKAAGAFSHTDKLVKYVWDALLVSFFIQDFTDYYAYPDYRNGRGLLETLFTSRGNKEELAKSLYNYYVVGILLGVPLTIGLLHSTYDYFRANRINPNKFPKNLLSSLESHWYSRLYKDYLRWVNPFNGAKRKLDKAQETLISDGRSYLTAAKRVALFNTLIEAIKSSRGMTRLYAIWTLQYLAYGVSTEDLKKLPKRYKTNEAKLRFREEFKVQLIIRTKAVKFLREIAKNNVPQKKYHLHERLLAEELLWEIGFPAKNPFHPTHGFALTVFGVDTYFKISLLILVIKGIQYSVDQIKAKRDCERAGKLWMYIPAVGENLCTVCGDFPLPYQYTLTEQNCLDNFLSTPRNATDVARLFSRLVSDEILSLDLSNQKLDGDFLSTALPGIVSRKHFSNIKFGANEIFGGFTPSAKGFKGFVENLSRITADNVTLPVSYDGPNNGTITFGEAIANAKIKFLDMSFAYCGNETLTDLAKHLNQTSLNMLQLGVTGELSEMTALIFDQLPSSQIISLYIDTDEILSSLVYVAIKKHLPKVKFLKSLFFNYNGVESSAEYGQALALGLKGSSVIELGLSLVNDEVLIYLSPGLKFSNLDKLSFNYGPTSLFGTKGMQALTEGLIGSPIQVLDLSYNCNRDHNICLNDTIFIPFFEKLPLMNLRDLNIAGNHISDAGIQALAVSLPYTSIIVLHVDRNIFGDLGLSSLGKVLPNCVLQEINVSYESINCTDSGIVAFVSGLTNSTIQQLTIGADYLSDVSAISLGNSLIGSSLQGLWFDSMANDAGMAALMIGVSYSNITAATIFFNSTSTQFSKAVLQNFHTTKVTYLELNGYINDASVVALGKAIKEGAPIESLSIGLLETKMNGLQVLVESLPHSQMTSLNVSPLSTMGAELAMAFGRYVPDSKLKGLGLDTDRDFSFKDESLATFLTILQSQKLQILSLAGGMITDQQAIIVANSLVRPVRQYRPVWINQIMSKHSYYQRVEAASCLTFFGLLAVNISTEAGDLICEKLPYTHISASSFSFHSDGDRPQQCHFQSSSAKLEVPLPFTLVALLLEKLYQTGKVPINKANVWRKSLLTLFAISKKQNVTTYAKNPADSFFDKRSMDGFFEEKYNNIYPTKPQNPFFIELHLLKSTTKSASLTFFPELVKDILLYQDFTPAHAGYTATTFRIALMSLEMPMLVSSGLNFMLSNALKYMGVEEERAQKLTTVVTLTYSMSRNMPQSFSGVFWIGMMLMSGYVGSSFSLDFEKYLVKKYLLPRKEKKVKATIIEVQEHSSFFRKASNKIMSPATRSYSYVKRFFSQPKIDEDLFENGKVSRIFGKGFDLI